MSRLRILLCCTLMLGCPANVLAQSATGSTGIEMQVTPYLWLPWSSIGVRPSNSRIPSASTTIDPGALISHLTWVPFMGAAEFRDGQFGLLMDFIHAPAKAGISTRDVVFSGGTRNPTLDTGTAIFLYRALQLPDQFIDAGIGVRAWGFDGSLALNQGLVRPVTVSGGASWADPLLGARYHKDLGNGYSVTAYGDIGGFGAGAHLDWQLVGTIDYALNSSIDLHGGFRSLNVNIGGSRADFDVHMYGPILSATLRF